MKQTAWIGTDENGKKESIWFYPYGYVMLRNEVDGKPVWTISSNGLRRGTFKSRKEANSTIRRLLAGERN